MIAEMLHGGAPDNARIVRFVQPALSAIRCRDHQRATLRGGKVRKNDDGRLRETGKRPPGRGCDQQGGRPMH